MAVAIRPAVRNDALHVAALMDIAGHGIEAAFWAEHAGPDHSAIDGARRRIISDTSLPYHLSKALLLETDGEVAGALIGGMVAQDAGLPEGFPDYFAPLLELEARAVGHWAVIAVAVYPEFRGMGNARRLLQHAEALARGCCAVGLSLVVEDCNHGALALYRSMGFTERERRAWLPYGDRVGPRHWLLLTRSLSGA